MLVVISPIVNVMFELFVAFKGSRLGEGRIADVTRKRPLASMNSLMRDEIRFLAEDPPTGYVLALVVELVPLGDLVVLLDQLAFFHIEFI